MINGFVPFSKRVTQMDMKIPCAPLKFPEAFREILLKMLHTRIDKRPDAKKALKKISDFRDNKKEMSKFKEAWESVQEKQRNLSDLEKVNWCYHYQCPKNEKVYTEDHIMRTALKPVKLPSPQYPTTSQPINVGHPVSQSIG